MDNISDRDFHCLLNSFLSKTSKKKHIASAKQGGNNVECKPRDSISLNSEISS